jgi:alcohol dehydrogenase, propanol-preferring
MRAFQLVEPGHAEVREVERPAPGPGQVLLRVAGAGVCHSDVHLLHSPKAPFPLPFTLGHEVGGSIEELGPGVDGWQAGDSGLVYLCWGCGRCRACAVGEENYCEAFPRGQVPGPGLGFPGAMADFVVVPARHLVPLGDLDPVDSAPLTDAALTSLHAINVVRARLVSGSIALVIGVGGLGHVAVQLLRRTSAARIIAVDSDEERLTLAREHGADDVVMAGSQAAAEVLGMSGGRGVDAVLDFVGLDATLELAAAVVGTRGHICIVGLARGVLPIVAAAPGRRAQPWGTMVSRPYGGTVGDLHEVLALAHAGMVALRIERFGLDEAPSVLQRLEAGRVHGRAVLVP